MSSTVPRTCAREREHAAREVAADSRSIWMPRRRAASDRGAAATASGARPDPTARCAPRRRGCRPTSTARRAATAARRRRAGRPRAARPSRRAARAPTCPRATRSCAGPSRRSSRVTTSVLRTSSASPADQVGAHVQLAVERAARERPQRRRQQRARREAGRVDLRLGLQAVQRRLRLQPAALGRRQRQAIDADAALACGSAATWKPSLRTSKSPLLKSKPRASASMRDPVERLREAQADVGVLAADAQAARRAHGARLSRSAASAALSMCSRRGRCRTASTRA